MSNLIVIASTRISSDNLVSGNLASSHAMIGETLSADALDFVVDIGRDVSGGFVPADYDEVMLDSDGNEFYSYLRKKLDMSAFQVNDSVLYYSDDVLVGAYYLQKITQISASRYKIEATSTMGLLAVSDHFGGMFSAVKASEIIADLLKGFSYSIDGEVASATISGYLPIAKKRDNLQQVLFATGGAVFTQPDGMIQIKSMSNIQIGTFGPSRCYIGGSVETGGDVAAVQLTEHNYFPSGEIETLYDEGVDGSIVLKFDAPHHDYACEGGTIVESGANYCKITASGAVFLTGQTYTHVTREITVGETSSASESIKTVTDAYLANPQIAQTLANRLFDFSQFNQKIKQDVLFGIERAGDVVSVVNPYTGESVPATITELDISMSAVNRASGEFLIGFTPSGIISGYKSYIVLTGVGYWEVPSTAGDTIRAIIVGAGSGGNGGESGDDSGTGSDGSRDYRSVATAGTGGAGGEGGAGGAGGKIFEVTLPVKVGDRFSYHTGSGGTGGTGGTSSADPAAGTSGTETIFGVRSSASGKEYPYGYYEGKTGLTLGASGANGMNGGKGGNGGEYSVSASSTIKADDGESVGSYKGGTGASSEINDYAEYSDTLRNAHGGGGGGGAANGNNGDNGSSGITDTANNAVSGGKGGNGGKGLGGANGATYGCGGGGGNGGGGGGGGGAAFRRSFGEYSYGTAYAGRQGIGGNGGNGGNGYGGVIIVYY